MGTTALLEAIAKLPREWRVTSTYSDGKVITLDQPFEASAEAFAKGRRRYLGKVFTTKDGAKVSLVSVTVTKL